MVIKDVILDELKSAASQEDREQAEEIVRNRSVTITKVTYHDESNFSIHGVVKGHHGDYDTYISAKDGEIDDLRCTCPDYESTYGTCRHILATTIEFNNNSNYAKLFAGSNEENTQTITKSKKINNEKYRIYRQMISTFYEEEQSHAEKGTIQAEKIKLEPVMIYNQNSKDVKVEFKIGNKQMYKIKNLPEFYDRMQSKAKFRYGLKLDFVHTQDAFEDSSIPALNFLMKYAEIIKYTNESADKYYVSVLNNSHIVLTSTGMDDFFEAMNGQEIAMETEYDSEKIKFIDSEPEIKFNIIDKSKSEYAVTTDEDIFAYSVIKGKEYIYFLRDNKLYRCSYKFENTVLKLLNIFRINFIKEIVFRKDEFADFYSLIMPKLGSDIELKGVDQEELKRYMPKELKVKVYLDYNPSNYITADVKFAYDDIEFSPFEKIDSNIPRNAIAEIGRAHV